ncbi:glyoxalase III HchA [Brevibacterium sp.]|uniref:glyoxalase III HchA n=1 Tax=Brevibacterium sp. TaxID=1701 RepID=UPI0028120D1A|nr:glyoxalase III HchA [Brevibacterium sp.]
MNVSAEAASTDDRNPTPDPAEDNAFFPSPYSLSQYTSPTTDFDGLSTEEKYTGDRWRVLVIGTEERYMLMRNNRFFSTGNHPVETLLPIHHMAEAGYSIDIATPTGAPAKVEWWAFPRSDDAVNATWNSLAEAFKAPQSLASVAAEGLDKYAAVFVPGGHGAMNGIPDSRSVQQALDFFLEHDRLIISLCHGPAAFLAAGLDRESNPFSGYSVVAFPDEIDFGANVDIGYLPGEMPWKLGERLGAAGITVTNSDMAGATLRDRNVLTGDSPLAANQLGKDSVAALLEQFGD